MNIKKLCLLAIVSGASITYNQLLFSNKVQKDKWQVCFDRLGKRIGLALLDAGSDVLIEAMRELQNDLQSDVQRSGGKKTVLIVRHEEREEPALQHSNDKDLVKASMSASDAYSMSDDDIMAWLNNFKIDVRGSEQGDVRGSKYGKQDDDQKKQKPGIKDKTNNHQPDQKKTMFSDIVGLDNVLVEVREVVDFLKNPSRFRRLGAQLPKGLLLEGPPGNGKTMIAKAIANEAGFDFLYVSASSFVELYVGAGAKHVRELFEQARQKKPCIIFIDEIDAIGAVSRGAGGNEEYRQTINELLVQLDGFDSQNDVVVIAATNHAKALDKALTRAGRFDRIIKVPAPDKEGRKKIIDYYLKKLPLVSPEIFNSLDLLSDKSAGLSSADLKNLVNESALLAVRDDAALIEKKHLDKGLEKVLQQRK